jgi:DNA helicase-2/ATP-dependent DNA helicase PcrA
MSANRLFIAAAGSGKTTLIVDEVLANKSERSIITTFTLANEHSIRDRLIKANNGYIPANVTIQTWFSFLIEHGIRPYRYWDKRVTGMQLVSTTSGLRYNLSNGKPVYWGEEDFYYYYFNSNMDVYSDKLSKLVYRCNERSNGYVIRRLEKIFNHIYIDEVQDMAGWDLELIKTFLKSTINLTMVGDPRQTIYLTHNDKKYSKYGYGKIKEFIRNECRSLPCAIDETTLSCSYRNTTAICNLSSKLYPELSLTISKLSIMNSHEGIYFVRIKELWRYYTQFEPMQLRLRKDIQLFIDADSRTFGESKGLDFHHVLIYPTKDMLRWLCGLNVEFKDKTRAQLYVALTRAFFSVGIVVDNNFKKTVRGITLWNYNDG